ncbi:MAG: FAD-dependent oxidoreductase [Planctomycetota bacterium]|nr:FAD-dependent oxidoreductase [Planctomycetota bacterium]
MQPLNCDHLVVGAGSTGLAVVDHLLRREAGSVVLVDSLEAPSVGPYGCRVPLLDPGMPQWSEVAVRARELYDGWADWLEVDPELRRCGVLMPGPSESSLPEGVEILEPEDSNRRWSALSSDGPLCKYDRNGSTVDSVAVAGALMWRMRKAGGRFHSSAPLRSLVEKEDGVQFVAGSREGVASKVFLCAGVSSLSILEQHSVRHPFARETTSIFTLDLPADLPPVIYWREERAILVDNGTGHHDLYLSRPVDDDQALPSVGWDGFKDFCQRHCGWIEGLSAAVTLKARAVNRIGRLESPPSEVVSAGGKILTPGACGEHSALFFPALAEIVVERHLSGEVGGLLEDQV